MGMQPRCSAALPRCHQCAPRAPGVAGAGAMPPVLPHPSQHCPRVQPLPSPAAPKLSVRVPKWWWGGGGFFSGCFPRLTAPRVGAQSPPVGAQPRQRLCPAPSLCLSQTWRHHGGVSKIYFTQRVGGKQGRKTSRSPRHVYRRGGAGTDTHRHLCAHPAWVLPPLTTHGGSKKSTAPLPSPPAPAAPPV